MNVTLKYRQKVSEFRVICVTESCTGGDTEMNIKVCGGEIVY